jgi:hypothetical protein
VRCAWLQFLGIESMHLCKGSFSFPNIQRTCSPFPVQWHSGLEVVSGEDRQARGTGAAAVAVALLRSMDGRKHSL